MKIIFLFLITVLLFTPISQSIGFFDYSNMKNATFISKYSSRSMDSETLNYYEKIKESYNIYIIKDSSVAANSKEWNEAYKNSDLIFVTNLNDYILNETRVDFCKNLVKVLNESVGLVFAGNSMIFNGNETNNISGCLYTQYFRFAEGFNNSDLIKSDLKIVESHGITEGYLKKTYNLAEENNVYSVVSSNNGLILARVNGDPDGSGQLDSADYPLIVLWQGITYNILSFGITTSKLTGCSECIDWVLFNQALDWVSDQNNMGFDIKTDKEEYYVGERININATSDIDIGYVSGKITYPSGKNYELIFTGLGKEWKSIYLLQDEDPNGEYTISANVGGLEISKKITVNVMSINVEIDNKSEIVGIDVRIKDKYGNNLDSQINITIMKESGLKNYYSYPSNSSIHLNYTVAESGNHTVYITIKDDLGRTQTIQKEFYYKLKPNVTFTPENITETVNNAINLTKTIYLKNEGNETLTNIVIQKGGEISDWIYVNKTAFNITKGYSFPIEININVPDAGEKEYKGFLNLTSDQGFEFFYITIDLDYLGELNVYPSSQTEWVTIGQSKEIEFWLNNSGKGNLEIKSITPSQEIEDWAYITNKPKILIPGGKAPLRVLISTEGVSISEIMKTVAGSFDINTDVGPYSPSPSLTLNVLSNILEKTESFYPNLIEIEKKIDEKKGKADISSFQDKADKIRLKITNTQSIYNNNQLETSYQMYNEIESEINDLKLSVEKTEEELIKKNENIKRIGIILGVIIVILVALYVIFKKVKESGQYSWLYKKWKKY